MADERISNEIKNVLKVELRCEPEIIVSFARQWVTIKNLNFSNRTIRRTGFPWCAFKSPALFLMASQRWSMISMYWCPSQRGYCKELHCAEKNFGSSSGHHDACWTLSGSHKIGIRTHSPFSRAVGTSLILEMDYSQSHLIYAHNDKILYSRSISTGTKAFKRYPCSLFRIYRRD